jgi:exopolysaccharide biosynthesis polyprenyl glycosylphosphotransferase
MRIMGILTSRKRRKTAAGSGSPLHPSNGYAGRADDGSLVLMPQGLFCRVLSIERKRSERSRQRFVLMLVHAAELFQAERGDTVLGGVVRALSVSTRETDLHGWYHNGSVVGVICTEIGGADITSVLSALHCKVCAALRSNLDLEQMNGIHISFHVFPDDLNLQGGGRPVDARLYPDLHPQDNTAKAFRLIKRTIDIVGSLIALVLLSPLFIAIAVVIKLTSKGPVFFKQVRVGQYGAKFTFLKFRSMYSHSNPKIHQEFVMRLISGKEDRTLSDDNPGVFKIQNDPRVTPVGRFLRRTSLDELPQFLNVLKGEMSLVGPRPPIPYEVDAYDIWHRRRFLEVKPGITGLWQVEGRSRIRFDEMVRLDLKYAMTWSPWLDIKILLRTPHAVLRGHGAY